MSLLKLYIYDKTDWQDRMQAAGRFSGDDDVMTIPIESGLSELKKQFQILAHNGQVFFDRVVMQTHGSPGRVWFGNDGINYKTWESDFTGFDSIFPNFTRLYFDGCNVAEGGDGTEFLRAAGYVFLKRGGGDVFGWTTLGMAVPGHIPIFGGHTLHWSNPFSGGGSSTFKRLRFFRGGETNWTDSYIP